MMYRNFDGFNGMNSMMGINSVDNHMYVGRGFGSGFADSFANNGPVWMLGFAFGFLVVMVAIIWTVCIKGFALWHAARRNEKWWFIALLVINTFGILELIYLIFYAKVLFQGTAGKKSSSNDEEKSGIESSIS